MWSKEILATTWMLVYFLLVLSAFVLIQTTKNRSAIESRFAGWGRFVWIIVLLITLVVRLLPMVILPVGARYDINSFRMVAETILNRTEVYSVTAGRHPYFPFQMYLIGGAMWVSKLSSLPFVVLIKFPAVLADVGITAVIYQSCRRWNKPIQEAAFWGLLYAFNPISILVSAYHGQFDAIPTLLLLIAWYYWYFNKQVVQSALFLGLAILNKTWPIVFLPIIFIRLRNTRQRILYTALSILIPVVFTLLYLQIFHAQISVLKRPLTYTGVAGYWGFSAIIAIVNKLLAIPTHFYTSIEDMRRWLLLAAGITTLWLTRKQHSIDALTTTILGEFVFSVGMGIQWLVWAVPFAILTGDHHRLKWYSLTGTLFLLGQLYGLHMYPWASKLFIPETGNILIRLSSIPAWITVIIWFGYRLFQTKPRTNAY